MKNLRLVVVDEELAVVLTLRDLQHIQELIRNKRFDWYRNERQAIMDQEDVLLEAIRRRAYELYEERGGEPGLAEQDWFRAEAEVLSRNKVQQVPQPVEPVSTAEHVDFPAA